jgi:threonine/homoserine/homoserine lactone efflux protein
MPGITDLWLFVAAGLLLNVSPGPDMALVMARSAQLGARAGAAAALGIGAGCLVHIAAAALGLSAILATSATAFTLVKLAGAAYLIWVGVAMLRHPAAPAAGGPVADASTSLGAVFVQGLLTNLLNPKVALFFLAFLPQFIAADAPSKAMAFVTLGLIFNLTGTAWNLGVAWFAARVSSALGAGSVLRTWIDRALGAMFVGLGVRLAVLERGT